MDRPRGGGIQGSGKLTLKSTQQDKVPVTLVDQNRWLRIDRISDGESLHFHPFVLPHGDWNGKLGKVTHATDATGRNGGYKEVY